MIDLTSTCVLVRTQEENEMILKEAEKQGFHWFGCSDCQPLETQHFPDILKFYNSNEVCYSAYIDSDFTFYEATELLGTKEMTAKEFVKRISDIFHCKGRRCSECVLSDRNTNNKGLCDVDSWKENIDEIIEIAKSGKSIILTEEKAIDMIENFIKNPDYVTLNDDFVDALKLSVEKLKKYKNNV